MTTTDQRFCLNCGTGYARGMPKTDTDAIYMNYYCETCRSSLKNMTKNVHFLRWVKVHAGHTLAIEGQLDKNWPPGFPVDDQA